MLTKIRPAPRKIFLCIACAASLSAAAQAESASKKVSGSRAESDASLVTLQSLLEEAKSRNPRIVAATYKAKAADAKPAQEGALPDPMIGFMSTNMSNPVPFTEIGKDPQANAGVNVSQELPFPGKRSLREKIALKEAQSEWQEAAATRFAVFTAVKFAYYELAFLEKASDILVENKQSLEKLARVAQAQYDVGKTSQQDILKARVETSIIQARILDFEQKRESALAELNALLGRDPAEAPGRLEPLTPAAVPLSFETLLSAAQAQSPMLLAMRAVVERSALQLESRHRDYYPDFTLGAFYGYSGDLPDMWQLRADVKVPLYFWEKQRNAVREAEHTLSEIRSGEAAALQTVHAELKRAFSQAKASEKLVELYDKRITPDAALTVESSLQGYQTGGVDFLTVLSNFITERDYRMSYFEELMKLRKALARMEELTGGALS